MSAVIDRVFEEVSAAFQWRSDREVWGVLERWDRPQLVDGVLIGDCDDFALECWYRLRDAGLHPRLAVCRTEVCPAGQPGWDHAVCLVEDAGAWLALDCRQKAAYELGLLPYQRDGWAWQVGPIDQPWDRFSIA